MKNHYEILKVESNVDDSEIKKAYYKLALVTHPDKVRPPPNDPENLIAKAAFQDLGNAYRTLSDPVARKKYDAEVDASSKLSQPSQASYSPQSPAQSRASYSPQSPKPFEGVALQLFEQVSKSKMELQMMKMQLVELLEKHPGKPAILAQIKKSEESIGFLNIVLQEISEPSSNVDLDRDPSRIMMFTMKFKNADKLVEAQKSFVTTETTKSEESSSFYSRMFGKP